MVAMVTEIDDRHRHKNRRSKQGSVQILLTSIVIFLPSLDQGGAKMWRDATLNNFLIVIDSSRNHNFEMF